MYKYGEATARACGGTKPVPRERKMKAINQHAGFPRAATLSSDLLAVGLLVAGLALPTPSYGHQRLVTGPLAMQPASPGGGEARLAFDENAQDLARLRFLLKRVEDEHDRRVAERLHSSSRDLSVYFDTAPRPTSKRENN